MPIHKALKTYGGAGEAGPRPTPLDHVSVENPFSAAHVIKLNFVGMVGKTQVQEWAILEPDALDAIRECLVALADKKVPGATSFKLPESGALQGESERRIMFVGAVESGGVELCLIDGWEPWQSLRLSGEDLTGLARAMESCIARARRERET